MKLRILSITAFTWLALLSGCASEEQRTAKAAGPTQDELVSKSYRNADSGKRVSLGTLRTAQIIDVQNALRREGYDIAVDGIAGPKTRDALALFQSTHDLKADGTLTRLTLSKLGLPASKFVIAE